MERLGTLFLRNMDGREKYHGQRLSKNYQLPNRPEWESLLRLTRSRLFSDKTSCFVELHYTGNNYFDDAERIEMDDLFTVGLGFKYLFSDRANLVVGVDDIFDKAPDTCLVPTGNGPTRTLWYPLQGRTFTQR